MAPKSTQKGVRKPYKKMFETKSCRCTQGYASQGGSLKLTQSTLPRPLHRHSNTPLCATRARWRIYNPGTRVRALRGPSDAYGRNLGLTPKCRFSRTWKIVQNGLPDVEILLWPDESGAFSGMIFQVGTGPRWPKTAKSVPKTQQTYAYIYIYIYGRGAASIC